ncbi:EFR1 family ferrodoxin [Dethiothermospora halolimnae]|uniref:EFR1 family ferrodoxin n=1 Tax=Dethiothermospora halolimnae TaxID=3114390 RepID=UPI003CCBA97F
MQIDRLTRIIFSPTGTTKKIVEEISKGLKIKNTDTINLTKTDIRQNFNLSINKHNELLIIGVPVYEEKIPKIIEKTLKNLRGKGQPIILITVYGNIGSGISLKQLRTLVEDVDFRVVGAGSFIGEHSFSNGELKIAKGRPDERDLKKAKQFGKEIRQKLKYISDIENIPELKLEGKLPLIAKILPKDSAKLFAKIPTVDKERCNMCDICINVCPVMAIDEKNLRINNEICLHCFACVKKCPKEARKINFKKKELVKLFLRKKGSGRKKPQIYY